MGSVLDGFGGSGQMDLVRLEETKTQEAKRSGATAAGGEATTSCCLRRWRKETRVIITFGARKFFVMQHKQKY
jgi:hypothetical protein